MQFDLEAFKLKLEEISLKSQELCKHTEIKVAINANKINQLSHEMKKILFLVGKKD